MNRFGDSAAGKTASPAPVSRGVDRGSEYEMDVGDAALGGLLGCVGMW